MREQRRQEPEVKDASLCRIAECEEKSVNTIRQKDASTGEEVLTYRCMGHTSRWDNVILGPGAVL